MPSNPDVVSPLVLDCRMVTFPLTNLCVARNSVDAQLAVPGLRLADLTIVCSDNKLSVTHEAPAPVDAEYLVPEYARLAPGDQPLSIVDSWHVPSFEVSVALQVPMQLVRAVVEHGVLSVHLERRPALN